MEKACQSFHRYFSTNREMVVTTSKFIEVKKIFLSECFSAPSTTPEKRLDLSLTRPILELIPENTACGPETHF